MLTNPYSTILKKYGWLVDLYTVDFFVERHWEKLPKAWQVYFDRCLQVCHHQDRNQQFQMNIELVQQLLCDNPCLNGRFATVGPPPLSYTTLKQCVNSLSLSYEAIENKRQLCKHLDIDVKIVGDKISFTNLLDQPVKLRSKLKPKKLHEVGRLCDTIDILLTHHKNKCGEDIKHVVDIGAGIGHLSRMFALIKNLDVTTIEGNPVFVDKSKNIDQMFMARAAGKEWKAPKRQQAYIKHTEHIDCFRKDDYHRPNPHVVVGLHSCGDLSATILRYFVHDASARILISVGCCYHKLNGGADKPFMDFFGQEGQQTQPVNISGYPMSKKFKDVHLSYASRELATFSKDRFVKRLQEDKGSAVLSIHSFRAALEHLILGCPQASQLNQLNKRLRHQSLSSVKNAAKMEFSQYVKEALKNHPHLLEIRQTQIEGNLAKVNFLLETQGSKVVVLIALRLILAPVIEAIVLEDRKEFLRENNLTSYAVPLFEPSVSPRNIVLISFK